MQKLVFGALVVGLFAVACGGGGGTKIIDANLGSGSDAVCDPIAQTGCPATTPRCTWIQDTDSVGHVGCVADGTIAVGGMCSFNPLGSAGSDNCPLPTTPYFDNCKAGAYCILGSTCDPTLGPIGTCETICDNNAGSAACSSGYSCGQYVGLFEVNGATEAGVCEKECDPLTDNSFGSGGSGDTIPPRSGSNCGTDEGCYGEPIADPNGVFQTSYTCSGELSTNHNLVHRSTCVTGTSDPTAPNCQIDAKAGDQYLNGCAQGYVPLLKDSDLGTSFAVCVAYCAPVDCYAGSGCGSASTDTTAAGLEPHACSNSDIRVDTANGAQEALPSGSNAAYNSCVYEWFFEQAEGSDGTASIDESATDNTVGFCFSHTLYHWDSNNNGNIDGSDAIIPPCNVMPGAGSDVTTAYAADWGCVSTTTATTLGAIGPSSVNHVRKSFRKQVLSDLPRVPHGLKSALPARFR
ncbi:MAG TPA: hypothetical protein VGG74_36440 [Kofleriaceae bacterium]|jgi:hypothetical protein